MNGVIWRLLGTVALLAILAGTRWPLLPAHLLNFDSANFALALERFNPAEHRPHPPGYPLFVGLAHVIHYFVEDMPAVFFLAGTIAAFAAGLLIYQLGAALAGTTAGVIAVALFAFHPAVWTETLQNPVRVFLAAGSAAIAFFAWKCGRPESPRQWFWLGWAVLGIVSGFRPTLGILLAPLLLVAGWRRSASVTDWIVSAGCLAAAASTWLVVVVSAAGGLGEYVTLLQSYLQAQSHTTSILFGAPLLPAAKMAGRAIVWAGTGAAAWIWAIPFARRLRITRETMWFFAIWVVPSLLLSTLVHSAEPGHILPLVPPICVLGGWVLASTRMPVAGTVIASALCGLFFFRPVLGVMQVNSVEAVRLNGNIVEQMVEAVDHTRSNGQTTAVASPDAAVAWRLLMWYFPEVPIIVLHGDPASPEASGSPPAWFVRRGEAHQLPSDAGRILVPSCGRIVWLLPPGTESPQPEAQVHGPVMIAPASPNLTLEANGFQFRTSESLCDPHASQPEGPPSI